MMILFCAPSRSDEVREFFNGSRMLGMGGAQIAVANDETALLANPAALGKLRDLYGTIIDPELDGGNNLANIYKTKSFAQLYSLQEIASSLSLAVDTYYHSRFQLFPSFVVKNFGIGIFYKRSLDAIMNTTATAMTTTYYDDLALLLGYNFRFFDGRIKLGVTGKFINRIEIANQSLDPTGNLDVGTWASEGAAVGVDAGLILTGPWTWLPTLAVVARDVGGTQFTAGKGLRMSTANIPNAMTQDLDVAVAIFPIHSNHTRSSFTIEYQKMTEAAAAQDKNRYYHVGYELNLSDMFFVRAGMNQKYWTAGLEFASEKVQMQISSYGEEVGVDGGTALEDRRYTFKFGFRF